MKNTLLIHNAKITTMDPARPEATALLIAGDRIVAVGDDALLAQADADCTRIDAGGRRLIPGLNDSHIHGVRQGLNHAMELRWDAQTSLGAALERLRDQAQQTPPGQWVRVVGGWSFRQFSERRHPTIEEINAATGDVPCYVLHLYDYAIVNRAGLRALGIGPETRDTYPRGRIIRDAKGNPTGLMMAAPSAVILYSLLNQMPKLPPEEQAVSTRHFLRELNRFGLTSLLDAGGGFLNYPEDYDVLTDLHREGLLSVRIGFSLFAQRPGKELEDFERWSDITAPDAGDAMLKVVGAGEMLRASAYDFEDFILPRPELGPTMEDELFPVVELLARKRWPFRFHATYDESATRILNVLETVNRAYPLEGLHWIFDHGETLKEPNIERIAALGGGISVQNRIAFQEEQFLARYGADAANDAPPLKKILAAGVPLGNGTDATRVSSYNPWLSIHWTVSGRGRGGAVLLGEDRRLDRHTALKLYTDNAWFSREEDQKGRLAPALLADFALLSDDYFSIPEEAIADLESVLTVLGGRVVHASGPFTSHAPAPLPALPEWTPLARHGGFVRVP
ncbi:MAG: amidohydrolase [Opitutales bacterium]|nr:amidohydrolase [Opitutales bacterium]